MSQTIESAEIIPVRGARFSQIGESGDFVYYSNVVTPGNDKIKVTVQKFKASTLELVESKDIFPRDFVPKEYVYHQSSCDVNVVLKNGKFYFFFSLSDGKEYTLFVKVMDENFANEKDIEIGGFKEKALGKNDKFSLAFSNDNTKVLLVLKKELFKATRAIGGATEIYQHVEFYGYDLIANKVLFSKVAPDDVNGLQLKSDNYNIDNKGNILFLVKLAEKKDNYNVLRELAIGYFEAAKPDFNTKKIDMSGFGSFIGNLKYLKNDDMVFIAQSGKALKISYVSVLNPKLNFEKSIDFSKSIKSELVVKLRSVVVSENNIYLTFSDTKPLFYDTPYNIFSICLSNDGNIVWAKNLPLVMPLYSYTMGITGINSFYANNKLNVCYMENKPYEMTPKLQKAFDENRVSGVVDNLKKFETVLTTIDADGNIKKQVVNDQEIYDINPQEDDLITKKGDAYLIMNGKKNFKLKKVTLK